MNFKNLVDDNALLYFFSKLKTLFASKTEVQEVAERVDGVIAEGGEPNKIDSITHNGNKLAIDNKNVVIDTVTEEFVNNAVQVSQRQQEQSLSEISAKQIALESSLQQEQAELVRLMLDNEKKQTAEQVQELINNSIADFTGIDFQIVDALPQSGTKGVIYLVDNAGGNTNSYDEYIYVNGKFEKIGTTDIDLSGYVLKSDVTIISNQRIDEIVAG